MFDFDPRDSADPRDREREDIYDPRWGEDPRDRASVSAIHASAILVTRLWTAWICRAGWSASWFRTSASTCTN